jgi:hypothetical protein
LPLENQRLCAHRDPLASACPCLSQLNQHNRS